MADKETRDEWDARFAQDHLELGYSPFTAWARGKVLEHKIRLAFEQAQDEEI